MSDLVCMVCGHEIVKEPFKYDDDLSGFVHVKCKPVCDGECQNWVPVKNKSKHKRVVQTLKKPMDLIKKVGEK